MGRGKRVNRRWENDWIIPIKLNSVNKTRCYIKNAAELIQFLSVNKFSFHGDFEETRAGHSSAELCLKLFKSAVQKDPKQN